MISGANIIVDPRRSKLAVWKHCGNPGKADAIFDWSDQQFMGAGTREAKKNSAEGRQWHSNLDHICQHEAWRRVGVNVLWCEIRIQAVARTKTR